MKKFDYHDYEYIRIPKELWKKWEEELKKEENFKVDFKTLKAGKISYNLKIEKKQKAANEASKIRKARSDMKIYSTFERIYNSLLKDTTAQIKNPNQLAKEAKVGYPKAKKFWDEYNLDYWLPKFEKNPKRLKDFLYKELSESLIYSK